MKTVKDIMSTDCVTVTEQETIHNIALKMKQNDIGFVPVVRGKKLVGVVTDRDLVLRGYAEKRPDTATADQVITRDIITISPNTTVDEAAKMMAKNKIRRLPVVENGDLVGVVALADLAVREIFVNEAGQALSEISENVNHMATAR